MAPVPSRRELRNAFAKISEEALDLCISICTTYRLTAEDFVIKWELFAVSKGDECTEPTVDALEIFRLSLAAELDNAIKKATTSTAHNNAHKQSASQSIQVIRRQPSNTQGTRVQKNTSIHLSHSLPLNTPSVTSLHSAKYEERTNRLKVEEVCNEQLAYAYTPSTTRKRCVIGLAPDQQVVPFRYMFDKILDKILNEQLEVYETWYREAYTELDELSRPDLPAQSSISVIGRIVLIDSEGGLVTERLTRDNIGLEVGRRMNGVRVRLHIGQELEEFALFPGQIVAVEGCNPTGRVLQISKIYKLPLLDTPTTSVPAMLRYHHERSDNIGQQGEPLLVMTVSGPYTLSDSLTFLPFKDIIEHLRTLKPDIVIITGPFIDDRHPLVQRGEIECEPNELFNTFIMEPLLLLLAQDAHFTQCIIIPSPHDLTSQYLTFPQPPLLEKSWRDAWRTHPAAKALQQVHLFPNPVQFYINEMLFAVTTNDILLHLGANECATTTKTGSADRLSRLACHILEQRSLYPLVPSVENEGSLEYSHFNQFALQASPDVMITPSQLKHMVKICNKTLIVNAGFVARGQAGGCFAKLLIYPSNRQALEDIKANSMMVESEECEAQIDHQVFTRTRVEIVRV